MGFYELSKQERIVLAEKIRSELLHDFSSQSSITILMYCSDPDTYIRKAAYIAIGRIYFTENNLQKTILKTLQFLSGEKDFKVRQTAVNAAGEIGKSEFEVVRHFFDTGLFDPHHSVRNAVIGSIKKMGEVNPVPVLEWAKSYLQHEDKEIRREICHGIELRGRKHPEDILPMLQSLQHDKTARVRNTLVHVIGQIAYKKGCLEKVLQDLEHWDNKLLVKAAVEEIIDVHHRYRDFSVKTQAEAIAYIRQHHARLIN